MNNVPQNNNHCGERYIAQDITYPRRLKPDSLLGWSFKITRDYVTHMRKFKTFDDAVAYKYKYLKEISPDSTKTGDQCTTVEDSETVLLQ